MDTRVIPIDELLKRYDELSKDPIRNKKEIDNLIDTIKLQKSHFDRINFQKLFDKVDSNDLDLETYKKYKKILDEKRKYIDNESKINNIIHSKNNLNKNNNRKLKRRKIYALLIGSAILLGVGNHMINKNNNNSLSKNNNNENIEVLDTTEQDDDIEKLDDTEKLDNTEKIDDTEVLNTSEEVTTQNINKNETSENNTNTTESNNDLGINNNVYNFVTKGSNTIDNMEQSILDPQKREETKTKAKKKAVEYIDFVFYGKEINGVKFDDLKDEEKAKVKSDLGKLVDLVNQYDPNYFNNLGERYSRFKTFGGGVVNSGKEKLKNKMGEDNYNKVGEIKDDSIDTIGETGGLVKKFVKDKYENWRSK